MSSSEFAVPVDDRYFEDYVPGAVLEYGRIPVTETDIIGFARRFDPQDMHVDPEAAAQRPLWRPDCERLAYRSDDDAAFRG